MYQRKKERKKDRNIEKKTCMKEKKDREKDRKKRQKNPRRTQHPKSIVETNSSWRCSAWSGHPLYLPNIGCPRKNCSIKVKEKCTRK